MAEEHNALKYGPSISKGASTVLGGAYGDVGISRLSESLVVVADLWSMPEWELPRGDIRFSRAVVSAAVALRFSSIELVNPTGSDKMAVVEDVAAFSGVTCSMQVDSGAALGTTATTRGVANDTRFTQLGAVSTCTVVTGDLAASTNLPQKFLFSSAIQRRQLKFTIAPGRKLFLIADTANSFVAADLEWRERSPFPGELQARG